MPPGKGLFFFFSKMNVLCILNGMFYERKGNVKCSSIVNFDSSVSFSSLGLPFQSLTRTIWLPSGFGHFLPISDAFVRFRTVLFSSERQMMRINCLNGWRLVTLNYSEWSWTMCNDTEWCLIMASFVKWRRMMWDDYECLILVTEALLH